MFSQLTVLVLAGLAGPLLAFTGQGLVPVVIGELAAGVVLGHTGIGAVDPASQPLPAFKAIGFAMLILAAGALVLLLALRTQPTTISHRLRDQSLTKGWAWQLRISLVLLLGLSAMAERTGASTLVAGFLAGMVIVRLHESDRLSMQILGLGNGFFVPLFFVLLGAELDLRALFASPSRIALAFALAAAAVLAHVIAAAVMTRTRCVATGLAASAQLGMPAAAASLGLSTHLLAPADAAALVAAGCLTLIPATVGSLLLARGGGTAAP